MINQLTIYFQFSISTVVQLKILNFMIKFFLNMKNLLNLRMVTIGKQWYSSIAKITALLLIIFFRLTTKVTVNLIYCLILPILLNYWTNMSQLLNIMKNHIKKILGNKQKKKYQNVKWKFNKKIKAKNFDFFILVYLFLLSIL